MRGGKAARVWFPISRRLRSYQGGLLLPIRPTACPLRGGMARKKLAHPFRILLFEPLRREARDPKRQANQAPKEAWDVKGPKETYFLSQTRSEERRVGKECRSRCWPEH